MTSVLQRIKPIGEISPWLRVLLYGQPGSGKTVFAASAPRPLILDTERGAKSLVNHPKLRNTLVVECYTFKDLHDIFWELKDENSELSKQIDTVVIDSVSELQKVQLDELLDAAVKKNDKRSPYLPEWQEYNMNTNAMRRIITSYRDLNKHLVVTAHSVSEKDGAEGPLIFRPSATPKLSGTLEGLMDIVGYMTLSNERDGTQVRKLQVQPDRRVRAKTRLALPPVLSNPSFGTLLSAYNNLISQAAENSSSANGSHTTNSTEEKGLGF